jgi:hypothetical protein
MGRARITYINTSRIGMFDKWADANMGNQPTGEEKKHLDCVARVANRIGADIRRNDCILIKLLSAKLAERLNCEPNLSVEAFFRLGAAIFGLYEGAKEAIKSVNLQL